MKRQTILLTIAVLLLLIVSGCTAKKKLQETPPVPERSIKQPETEKPVQTELDRKTLQMIETAQELVEKGEYNKAMDVYNRAAKLNPEMRAVYAGRGRLFYVLKQYDKAEEDYQKVMKNNPAPQDYINIADIYLLKGENNRAKQVYEEAVKIDPKQHRAYYHIGVIDMNEGNYEDALKNIEKAISLEDKDNEAYLINKGYVNYKLRHFDEAVKDYKNTLEKSKNMDVAYAGLGTVYAQQKDFDKALECYNKAIELYPRNVKDQNLREINLFILDMDESVLYRNRAVIYLDMGENQKAINDCNKAFKTDDKVRPEVYLTRGMAFERIGKRKDALKDVKLFLEKVKAEDNYDYYSSMSDAHFILGDYKKAFEYINKAIDDVDWEETSFYNNRAIIKYHLKDYKGARSDFDRVVDLKTDPIEIELRKEYLTKLREKGY